MRNVTLLLLALLVAGFSAQGQEPNDRDGEIRYISDDLYTFLHSGPGRNYRILGSVQAGTRVTQLQFDRERNFVEIIDDKQRSGWVDAEFITSDKSLRERLPEVQRRLDEVTEALRAKTEEADRIGQQLADLTGRNRTLQRELSATQNDLERVERELAGHDQSAQMEWFTRGGIIAIIGIIFGVVIAYLPKKRRRNDQWM